MKISVSTDKILLKYVKPKTPDIQLFTEKNLPTPSIGHLCECSSHFYLQITLISVQKLFNCVVFINIYNVYMYVSLIMGKQVYFIYSHNSLPFCRHSICSVYTPSHTSGPEKNGSFSC